MMNDKPQPAAELDRLPGYPGIRGVTAGGLPVEARAEKIARFAAVKRSMVGVAAGRMTGVQEWELKAFVARALWEDALASRELERRLQELQGPSAAVNKVRRNPLGDFFTGLLHGPDSLSLCVGWFEVLAPDLIAALRAYLSATEPIADQPSVGLLRQIVTEEQERLEAGRRFIHVLSTGHEEERGDWRGHFQTLLKRGGGVWGDLAPQSDGPKLTPVDMEDGFDIGREFKRGEPLRAAPPETRDVVLKSDKLPLSVGVKAQEITAAERMASVLYQWEDLPIDWIVDMARHCWNDMHSRA